MNRRFPLFLLSQLSLSFLTVNFYLFLLIFVFISFIIRFHTLKSLLKRLTSLYNNNTVDVKELE